MRRIGGVCASILIAIVVLLPVNASAAYAEQAVDEDIAADGFWSLRLDLAIKDPVSISLTVTGGVANFYFMDSEGYTLFNNAWNSSSPYSMFSYYPDLSSKNANSISKSGSMPTTDTYYVVVYCDDFNVLHLSGKVTSGVKPADLTTIIIPIAILACMFAIPIAALQLQKRNKRIKMENAIASGAMPHCPMCGALNDESMFFCASCGFKLK